MKPKIRPKRGPRPVQDHYLDRLTDQDRAEVQQYANWLLQPKAHFSELAVRDAWIEAIINLLLRKGLLRPLED